MKISLIGGAGFVGTRLIELLTDHSHCQILDKRLSDFYPEISRICDIRNADEVKAALSGQDLVVLLAAEHRDDVSPISLYYDVNVQGMHNVLEAMKANGVKRMVFTSSVAIYGLNKIDPNESHPQDPFNHYGKSKWQAEELLKKWHKIYPDWNINIIRPTVIFGERNRGNVYNLLKQIVSGRFMIIGPGENKKSMAYVGNVVAFIEFLIRNKTQGYNVFNYVDKPDFTMNELARVVGKVLKKTIPALHIPYICGLMAGFGCDILSKIIGKKLAISSVRVRKFCATTQYNADAANTSGFTTPFSLEEGLRRTLEYEFVMDRKERDDITFQSE